VALVSASAGAVDTWNGFIARKYAKRDAQRKVEDGKWDKLSMARQRRRDMKVKLARLNSSKSVKNINHQRRRSSDQILLDPEIRRQYQSYVQQEHSMEG
jgi:hypothetical protein